MGWMFPAKSGPICFDDVGVKNISRLRCLLTFDARFIFRWRIFIRKQKNRVSKVNMLIFDDRQISKK